MTTLTQSTNYSFINNDLQQTCSETKLNVVSPECSISYPKNSITTSQSTNTNLSDIIGKRPNQLISSNSFTKSRLNTTRRFFAINKRLKNSKSIDAIKLHLLINNNKPEPQLNQEQDQFNSPSLSISSLTSILPSIQSKANRSNLTNGIKFKFCSKHNEHKNSYFPVKINNSLKSNEILLSELKIGNKELNKNNSIVDKSNGKYTNLLKFRAKQVWDKVERKLENSLGSKQSKSVNNLANMSHKFAKMALIHEKPDKFSTNANFCYDQSMTKDYTPSYTKSSLPHSHSVDANILQVLQNCSYNSNCSFYCPQCRPNHVPINCYCERDNYVITKPENQPKPISNMNEYSGFENNNNNTQNRLLNHNSETDQISSNYNSWMKPMYNRELPLIQELREITLTRQDSDCRFGIRMEKCNNVTYVTTVLAGSIAAHAGLKTGDEICTLNEYSADQLSIHTINQLVRSTPKYLKLVYRPRKMYANVKFLALRKLNGKIGIKLDEINGQFFVSIVLQYSAAYLVGIQVGDELINVNNQFIHTWSHNYLSQYLRQLPNSELILMYFKTKYNFKNYPDLNTENSKFSKNIFMEAPQYVQNNSIHAIPNHCNLFSPLFYAPNSKHLSRNHNSFNRKSSLACTKLNKTIPSSFSCNESMASLAQLQENVELENLSDATKLGRLSKLVPSFSDYSLLSTK